MKKLLLLLLAFVYSFSLEFKQDFLEPEEAFKTSFTKNEDSLNFKLDLGDKIYLYDDKLQVFNMMAANIADWENQHLILDNFKFVTSREKAKKTIDSIRIR